MGQLVRIASPCKASWEKMAGDDRIRHCDECNLNVYNFAAMTSVEVEELIATTTGRLCGRLYQRADGTFLTKDCPEGFKIKVRRVSRIAGAALAAATIGANFAAAQAAPTTSHGVVHQHQADLTITVTDQTGAVLPKAHLKLTGKASESRDGMTNAKGILHFTGVMPGNYDLEVSAVDFRTASQKVFVRENETVNISLEVDVAPTLGAIAVLPTDDIVNSLTISQPDPKKLDKKKGSTLKK